MSNTNEQTTSNNESNITKDNNKPSSNEASANVEKSKNSKYFSEIESLYILGKHYPNPIGKRVWKILNSFVINKIFKQPK